MKSGLIGERLGGEYLAGEAQFEAIGVERPRVDAKLMVARAMKIEGYFA